ncbi:MAG: transporter [Bacteroidales bacterium]|nr:transporter [Bacteroidales bacterium]
MELFTTTHVAFFLIVAAGIALGKLKIKGISLDISAVIFVALIFGHFGIKMPLILQKLGLILFMFSVGIQAGPGFFESFRRTGKILIALAVLVITSGAGVTMLMAWIYDIDYQMAVGLFTGALTSTSGLAAAIESTQSPAASIGFGIAYPFGVIGVILFARLSPQIFRVDIREEERKFEAELQTDHPRLISRNFIVENPNIFGMTLHELDLRGLTSTNISRIVKKGEVVRAEADTRLEKWDLVRAVGTQDNLKRLRYLVGRETDQEIPMRGKNTVRSFLVTNKQVINKSLQHLGLLQNYNATVTTIRRSGIDITPRATSKLRFGDKLTITLPQDNAGRVGEILGDSRKKMDELNFLPIALGILLGILLGELSIPLFGDVHFRLGLTGGVLVSALVLSKIGKTGSIIWNISGTVNMFLRKLGLIMFLSVVGTHAGEHLVETIMTNGIRYFVSGIAITLVPMVLTISLGYYVLRMNFLSLIGSLTGSMTSTPALSAVEPMTDTNAPQIAYATVYPFALVLLIIVSQLLGGL